jgi:hypothetical protein
VTRPPGDCLWISWIDREGVILSSGFNFFENLPLLLVLLLVLQRFGRSQWGYIPELSTEDHSVLLYPMYAGGSLGEDQVAVNFYPEDEVHSARSPLGRATTVVGANRNDDHGASVNLTKTDPPATVLNKVHEVQDEKWRDFYQARNDYRTANANTIKSHDLVLKVSWPETSRVEEWRIIGHAQMLGKEDKFIGGHIPDVKYARDFEHYSTDHIRRFLGLKRDGKSGTRTLRLIAIKRMWPIYDMDGKQFWKAFLQSVACMKLATPSQTVTDVTTQVISGCG